MKHRLIMPLTLDFLLVLPVQVWTVELTLRNEEQSPARVAIAYKKGDSIVVEGRHVLDADQSKILYLPTVGRKTFLSGLSLTTRILNKHFLIAG